MESGGTLAGLWRGAEAVVAILPALAGLRLLRLGHSRLAAMDEAVVARLALGTGLVLGVALLLAMPHGDAFRPGTIFAADGPWQVGLGAFMARHALPLHIMPDHALAGGLAMLLAGGMLVVLRRWHGRAALHGLVAVLLLSAGTALLLHYALHLLAWLVAMLNFWLFALALFGVQRWRHAVRRQGH